MLLGMLDLETWQPSYTVMSLLIDLEVARRATGERDMEIEFNPGTIKGFGRYHRWPREHEDKVKCLNNIALPMCHMLPGVTSVRILKERRERPAHAIGSPGNYDWSSFMNAYRAGIRPLRYHVDPGYKNPKLITITLRECGKVHWSARDSNVKQWVAAASELIKMGYEVVVLRDARFANVPLAQLTISPHASMHVAYRAELYNRAALNLFVNNGPAWFAMAMDLPTILFRPTCEGAGKSHTKVSSAAHGVIEGRQIEGAPAHQVLSWTSDDCASILAAVAAFPFERR
jgi:hypothetical protein